MKAIDVLGLVTIFICSFLAFAVSAAIAIDTFNHETGIAALTGMFVSLVFYAISLLCNLALYKAIVKK